MATIALRKEPCVVRGNGMGLELAPSWTWRDMDLRDTPVLVSVPASSPGDEVKLYVEYVGNLLSADLDYCSEGTGLDTLLERAMGNYALAIYGKAGRALDERPGLEGGDHRAGECLPGDCLTGHCLTTSCVTTNCLPIPLLVAHRPRQPLKRLLLIVQGAASDRKAANWALRLAASSGAKVTALAVVPPNSAVNGFSRFEGGLAELLSADTVLGCQMRHIAQRLVDEGIECTLRLRQGPPMREIRREAAERAYDLVVVAVAPHGATRRWHFGEPPVSVLRLLDRPTLIAA